MDDDDRLNGAQLDPALLAHADAARRGFLRKLVVGTAYAVPAVASFSLAGLSAADAQSYMSNV
jgi:hypothetical protein